MLKEGHRVTASSPGRICLGGENLDWMINGPSVVGAINLRTRLSVKKNTGGQDIIIKSSSPLNVETSWNLDQIGQYHNDTLDFINAAIKIMWDKGLSPTPLVIDASTELPIRAGVSSSAAISLASVTAISEFGSKHMETLEICSLAYDIEKRELKTGAGQMDFYACGLGKLHYLNCQSEPPSIIEEYAAPDVIKIVLVDTLTPRKISDVLFQIKNSFSAGEPTFRLYVDKTLVAVEKLRGLIPEFTRNIEEVGHYLNECQVYLRDNLRTSTELLDKCVEACLANGAYGAKMTGTGMGGCMYALTNEENTDRIQKALSKLPVKTYVTSFSNQGINYESHTF